MLMGLMDQVESHDGASLGLNVRNIDFFAILVNFEHLNVMLDQLFQLIDQLMDNTAVFA